MDSLTHFVLGASIGQVISDKKRIHRAALVGALAASAPDLDVLIYQPDNPLSEFLYHRSFTHSLLFIPFGAVIVWAFLLLIFKSWREDWRLLLLVGFCAYATHGLLDACTSYGTQLFWPFSHYRVSLDWISIVDPVFTIPLIIGALRSWWKETRKPALYGLIFSFIYLVGFCSFQHHRALEAEQTLIRQSQTQATAIRVMPALASVYSWNSLYISNNQIYVGRVKTPLFGNTQARVDFSVPVFQLKNLPASFATDSKLIKAAQTFLWFTQGYASVVSTKPFVIADIRYLKKGENISSLWSVELIKQNGLGKVLRLGQTPIIPIHF